MTLNSLEQYLGETPNAKEGKIASKEVDIQREIESLVLRQEMPSDLPESFIVGVTYDGEKHAALVKLYETKSAKIYFWYDNTGHKPYCFSDLPEKELQKIDRLITHNGFDHFEVVEKYDSLKDQKVKMTKIVAKDPLAIGGLPSGCIRDIIPKAWEADIRYYENFIYDRNLAPGMLYKIDGGKLIQVDQVLPEEILGAIKELFENEPGEYREHSNTLISLFQSPVPKIRRVAMDIEVYSPIATRIPDPEAAEYPVICVSFVSSDGIKKVLVLKRDEIKDEKAKFPSNIEVEFYDDERLLLIDVFKVLLQYPVVVTFNGDQFDMRYLWHRAQKIDFRLSKEIIPIEVGKDFTSMKYGVHIDLYRFFFNRSIQVYAFNQKYREVSLGNIGKALLGLGKLELSQPVSNLSYEDLATYCLRDSEITFQLTTFDDDLVMNLIMLLSRIARMPIEDVTRSGVSIWIRSMMFYEHRLRNMLIPRSEDLLALKGVTATEATIKGKKYKGAIVVEPTPGVYFDVAVLDFASLYPSIIKRWNLSYETILCSHPECRDNKVPGTPYWICVKRLGLSSILIGSLKDLRVKWYKPKSRDGSLPEMVRNLYATIQQALKVVLNASYGVFGAEHFSLFCLPVAESTAAIGRYAITNTIEKAQSLGIPVLYGDTDSIFLKSPAEKQINGLIEWSEKSLGMDLDVDKVYRYAAFSNRKKNYLGVYSDGSVDIKGLTGKKRNTPEFLKEAFSEMVKVLSEVKTEEDFKQAKEKLKKIVRACYTKLKRREYTTEELSINIMLGKMPEKYYKTTPQHVKAAFLLARRGIELRPGDIIGFVKVFGDPGVKPVQLVSINEVDTNKYVEFLESTFEQVLDALGLDFHEILGLTRLERFMGSPEERLNC